MPKRKPVAKELTENEILAQLEELEDVRRRLKAKLAVIKVTTEDPRNLYLPMSAEDMEIAILNLAQRQSAGGLQMLARTDAPSALEQAGIELDEKLPVREETITSNIR